MSGSARAQRSSSTSPSPVAIRKNRPLQNLPANQLFRRPMGDENKENFRPLIFSQRSSGNGKPDPTSVILQPPTHPSLPSDFSQGQSASQSLISKSSIQQVPLGMIPLTTTWGANQIPNPGRYGSMDRVHRTAGHSFPQPFMQPEPEEHDPDPFAQLSARTLALMDQPESEVTIYDCEYCEKTYQGKHARSIWRRHLSDKHKIPLATQPRRTRWDNDANRPKTEEERRERTLESKRRWARKNRAAKKAARDGQRNAIELAAGIGSNRSESMTQFSHRTPSDRSRASSPSLFLPAPDNTSASAAGGTNQSNRVESCGQNMARMTRAENASQIFAPYPSVASRTSTTMGDAAYSSFLAPQGAPTCEWSFQMPSSQSSSYSFESYASLPTKLSSTFSLAARLSHESLESNYPVASPQSDPQAHNVHTLYQAEVADQTLSQQDGVSECFPSAPSTSEYNRWHPDGGSYVNMLPTRLNPPGSLSYESPSKRPRLSEPSPTPIPFNHFEALQKAYGSCNLEALPDTGDFHSSSTSEHIRSSVMSCTTQLDSLESTASPPPANDKAAENNLNFVNESSNSPTDGRDDIRPSLNSPIHPGSRNDEALSRRPHTAGTLCSLNLEHETRAITHSERAATEPQHSLRHELQTPSRDPVLRSATRLHLAHSPLCRMDGRSLDSADFLTSPAVTRGDPNTLLYHGHYAPMSTGRRRISEAAQVPLTGSSHSLALGDWSGQTLHTPSEFSRFPFNTSMLSSPAGGSGFFGSPHNNLNRSLGLTINGSGPQGEDSLGGLLMGCGSPWDVVHQRT